MAENERGDNQGIVTPDKVSWKWLSEHIAMSFWLTLGSVIVATFLCGLFINNIDAAKKLYRWCLNDNFQKELKQLKNSNRDFLNKVGALESINFKNSNELNELKRKNKESQDMILSLKEGAVQLKVQNQKIQKVNNRMSKGKLHCEAEIKKLKSINNKLYLKQAELRKKLESLSQKRNDGKGNTSGKLNMDAGTGIGQNEIKQLKDSAKLMYSSDLSSFLIENVPKIKGGIGCHDLAEMLRSCYSSEVSEVVKAVAPYIQRPFPSDCFRRLSATMYSGESASAISALVSSKRRY